MAYRARSVLALASLLAMAGCSSDSSLNGNKLEQQIQRRIKSAGVNLRDISCPNERPLRKGDAFDCRATARNGAKITVRAVQDDAKGNVSWNVTSGLLDVSVVQRAIQEDFANVPPPQGPVNVSVNCQSGATVAADDGDTFDCKVANTANPADSTTVKVTVSSAAENGRGFDWAPLNP